MRSIGRVNALAIIYLRKVIIRLEAQARESGGTARMHPLNVKESEREKHKAPEVRLQGSGRNQCHHVYKVSIQ